MFSQNHLALLDYIVVGITLAIPMLIGFYHAYKSKHTTEDLLVGSRKMGTLPVAASIMVTFLSAVSFLGMPSEVYVFDIQILMLGITGAIFTPLSAFLFVPVLYNLKLTSAYEYLERRFESVLLRRVSSIVYLFYTMFMQALGIYAPCIAMETVIGIPVWMSIIVIGLTCTAYTSMGGFKAVIWTDFFQLILLLSGMFIIMVRAMILAGGPAQTFQIASENGRLRLFDFTIDPFMRQNTLNILFGFGLKSLLTMATHQNQVQRYASVPTEKAAIRSIIFSIPFNLISYSIICTTGLSIYAVYSTCDPLKEKKITKPDQLVPYFVTEHLSAFPGILGLFLSCIFCAVLSTFSSGLNSITAVLWEDYLIQTSVCKRLAPRTKACISRGFVVVVGTCIIGFAFLIPKLGTIIQMSLSVMGTFAGPMASMFVLGIFVPFANKFGAMFGLLAGLCCTFFIAVNAYLLKKVNYALPTSIEGCLNTTAIITNSTTLTSGPPILDSEWPEKIFTISFHLYTPVGAAITLTIGIIISLCTGGLSTIKNVKSIYIHPWLRHKFKLREDSAQLRQNPAAHLEMKSRNQ